MDPILYILKKTSLFADLTLEEIGQWLLPFCKVREIPKDGYLIDFQERCEGFGVVLSGRISLMHIYGNGNYGIIGILEEGDVWGADLAFTKSKVSPYYARALEPASVAVFPSTLALVPGTLPETLRLRLLQNALMYIADENIRKEYRLAILFQKGLRDRVMTFLVMQANKRQSDTFAIPFSRDEMASYLCVNRTCLSRELGQMKKEGLIRFRRNTFTLMDWKSGKGEYEL